MYVIWQPTIQAGVKISLQCPLNSLASLLDFTHFLHAFGAVFFSDFRKQMFPAAKFFFFINVIWLNLNPLSWTTRIVGEILEGSLPNFKKRKFRRARELYRLVSMMLICGKIPKLILKRLISKDY